MVVAVTESGGVVGMADTDVDTACTAADTADTDAGCTVADTVMGIGDMAADILDMVAVTATTDTVTMGFLRLTATA